MAQHKTRKLILSLSVAAALGCSAGNAFADGDRVEALETRIAELEALVQQLLNRPAPKAGPSEAEVDAMAEAAAEEKVNAMLAEHKAVDAEKEHKHKYKFGGYVKTDVIYSDFGGGSVSGGSAGRDFYIPGTIPVGDSGETYLDLHAKESRINFRSEHNLDNGAKMTTFIEMDFLLSGQGNERVSNSFSPRLRHAFLTYNKWLFGQTWMTFFNVGALPENLDFVGPAESTIFGRQAMIRYTNGPWQFAAENPESTITPYGGGGRIVSDDSRIPDFVGRYNLNRDWGNFTVAAIYRELRYENSASGIDDSETGYGISLSGKFKIGDRDDFRWMASTGKGLGRYMGLNTANGAVLDADGNLEAIDSYGIFGSYRHFWNDKWRSNLTLGYLKVDNDVELTGTGVTKKAQSAHVNLIYSPVPKMDFGFEFMYADREVESGADGDLTRLQFSAKYAF
ncbi:MAG: porin [Gammaproteobacteria bacterium]|nr:porin [Gammaproteobacteria bacterium]